MDRQFNRSISRGPTRLPILPHELFHEVHERLHVLHAHGVVDADADAADVAVAFADHAGLLGFADEGGGTGAMFAS